MVSLLMASCRAYVCLSAREGFGWSMFEAMVHSRPVVARHVGIACGFKDKVLSWTSADELVAILNSGSIPDMVQYDLQSFTAEKYRMVFEQALREHESLLQV